MLDRKEIFFIAAVLLATFLIYNQTISWLLSNWLMNPYLNYGILVPLLSFYMVFRDRKKLNRIKRKYDESGFILVFAGLVFYWVDIFLVKWFALYLFFIGNMLIFYGKKRVRAMAGPLLFLLLATPVPDYILEFIGLGLKQISVGLAIWMASLLTEVSVVGDNIYLGDASFYIGLPCSGLESFLGFGIFAVFFAYLFEKGKRRLVLISSCLLATVFFNSVRMFTIFISAVAFGEETAMSLFHTFSGTLLVALYTVILLFIYRERI